jgi:hypothetical protein
VTAAVLLRRVGSPPAPIARTPVPDHDASPQRDSDAVAHGRAGDPHVPDAGGSALTFPDLPRLELDQLLGQLVERAQEVMATQGRLRGLLRAHHMITGGLRLPVVLHRITEAARELVGARYAALGVLAPDGGLAEFVHTGMPADLVAGIGHLPQGKGLLGALVDDPEPIRLARIADDPRSCGFPPGHPPMNSFLGVPIRIRNEVFGNLYLADSTRDAFSTDDEELVRSLAATAAAVIDNARLYEAARARGEWLQASAAITRRLLSTDVDDANTLRLIADHARQGAGADLVTVELPDDDTDPDGGGDLRTEVAVGTTADGMCGRRMPQDGSLSGRVFTTGTPLRVSGPDERAPLGFAGLDTGPVLVVPLLGSHTVHGVLTAVRRRARSAPAGPPTASWRPWSTSTPPSARSAPRSSPSSRFRRPCPRDCAPAYSTSSPTSPPPSGSNPPSGSRDCSTPSPTPSPTTCSRFCAKR